MTAVLVFICQYFYICLLGLQSRNVQHANYVGAAVVSTMLGIFGLTITTILARAAIVEGGWPVWVSFVLAGPCGICSAIRFDKWWRS